MKVGQGYETDGGFPRAERLMRGIVTSKAIRLLLVGWLTILVFAIFSFTTSTAEAQSESIPCDKLEQVLNAQRRATYGIVTSDITNSTGMYVPPSLKLIAYAGINYGTIDSDEFDIWWDMHLIFSAIIEDFKTNGLRGDDQQWKKLIETWDAINVEAKQFAPDDILGRLLIGSV